MKKHSRKMMRGGEFEILVLGKRAFPSGKPIKFREEDKDSVSTHMRVAEVIVDQGDWNPFNPKTPIAYDLLHAVFHELMESGYPEFETVGLYRSVGTSLDLYHGADMFFAVQEGDSYHAVLVDLTNHPFKHEWAYGVVYNADMLYQNDMTKVFAEEVCGRFWASFRQRPYADISKAVLVKNHLIESALKRKKLLDDIWAITHPYSKVCCEFVSYLDLNSTGRVIESSKRQKKKLI